MNRSTLKAIGLLVLIPSLFIALMPVLAAHTSVLNTLGNTHLTLGSITLINITHDALGNASVDTSNLFWFLAGAAELGLIALQVAMPTRSSRYQLNG